MIKPHEPEFDASRPALILLFGNTSKKNHMLDRDVIVIGRARGCDLGLDAPDISSVHCVITRGQGGYHLRDCQSRAGTKYNGNLVREARLHDGDLLQIGPFSFRVQLPAGCIVGANTSGNTRLPHLEKSRRNLARMALRQRKLLKVLRVVNQDDNGNAAKDHMTKQLLNLKARIRDYDQRVRILEDAERDLAKDRETLDREIANLRAQAQQSEQHNDLSQQLEAFEQEKKEFYMTREQWGRDQAAILERLGQQKSALARAEEALREQRHGLDEFLTIIQEGGELPAPAHDNETQKLFAENQQMRELIAAMEIEHKQANSALATANAQAAVVSPQPENSAEVATLRKQLEEKDARMKEMECRSTQETGEHDIDSYESELNEFRRQLESDRQKLMREVEQMRARNKELDEATREMELEMSRERAELARERQRLERLREDVRQELERMQRDAGLRDRLAPVQNLREEMNHRRHPAGDTPRVVAEDPVQARLRVLRNKVNEQ